MEATHPRVLWKLTTREPSQGSAAVQCSRGVLVFLILFEPKYNTVFVFLKLEIQRTISKILDLGFKL